ncbi:MAG: transposase, partial [Gammaproteobacteria bacterium]|nr:transposase [Gammaproteobacteria bacterium]
MKAALEKLSQRGDALQAMAADMQQSGATHRVRGEPDARVMRKAGSGGGGGGNGVNGGGRAVGYHVQAAVDAKHKLIASCEVTTAANDHGQLYPQAKAAKVAVGADKLTVVADAGYKSAAQSRACEAMGVSAVLPAHREVNPCGAGKLFSREAFECDAERDQYTCPGGETLKLRRVDAETRRYTADANACGGCLLKGQCTPSRYRTVKRQIHAEALERANKRAAERPELLRRRAALVEHPFGNLKRMMD